MSSLWFVDLFDTALIRLRTASPPRWGYRVAARIHYAAARRRTVRAGVAAAPIMWRSVPRGCSR